jgi:hypothetical protein
MTRESRCPPKIERLDRIHRELLDRLLKDNGTMITKRGLVKETHRPLSVKQIAWIMITIFGVYISRQTLYHYLSWLEEEKKKDEEETLSTNHT